MVDRLGWSFIVLWQQAAIAPQTGFECLRRIWKLPLSLVPPALEVSSLCNMGDIGQNRLQQVIFRFDGEGRAQCGAINGGNRHLGLPGMAPFSHLSLSESQIQSRR